MHQLRDRKKQDATTKLPPFLPSPDGSGKPASPRELSRKIGSYPGEDLQRTAGQEWLRGSRYLAHDLLQAIGEDTNRGHAEACSTPHRHRSVHPEVPVERKAEGVQENEQQQPDQAVVGGGGLVLHQVHDEPHQQDHVQQTPQNGDGEERAKQVQDI